LWTSEGNQSGSACNRNVGGCQGYDPAMRFTLILFAALLCGRAGAQNAPAKPIKLGLCVGCHGERGHAQLPEYPNLAGQNRAYLVLALNAYQSGARSSAPMRAVVGTLKPADIAALADWFSAQKLP
jgi:cytochrome c553